VIKVLSINQVSIDAREYVIINRDLLVVKASREVYRFADCPQEDILGQDVRLAFPELIGIEPILNEILTGKEESFLLEGIARSNSEDCLVYFDLVVQRYQKQLIIYLADVTELMRFKQPLLHRANEAEVLLSALKRFEDYTNKILTSMADVFFITTASGQIKKVNQAGQKLFGYTELELLHQPISQLIINENFNHQNIYSALIQSDQSLKQIELTCINKEGKILEIEFSCSIIETEVQGVFNCIYIGRDITARKQAEEKMWSALAKEKELRELKSRFISMASHEFRNPVTSILICSDLLQQKSNNLSESERNVYLSLIADAARNISSLLEDVLIVSLTEEGNLQFKPKSLQLENVCCKIIEEIIVTAQERKINFTCNGINSPVIGDEKLLRYILTNLLSNAIKYSPTDTEVDFTIQADCEQENKVIFQICDRGIGIPPKDQKHLFQSFYRAHNVGGTPGTGLGLSIVKKAVELHQGEITIESELGVGTTVKVILPLHQGKTGRREIGVGRG
jgi:PAS domain S-box-containing protein